MTRVLVAGMGNELLGDDGFGIVVARRFEREAPGEVRVVESGIAGIGLVQDLMDRFEAAIICDAADRGDPPGTLRLLEFEVPSVANLDEPARRALLADMHATVPARALVLARAAGVLPARTFLLGCQPASTELGVGLSETVERSVGEAVRRLHHLVAELTGRPAAAVR